MRLVSARNLLRARPQLHCVPRWILQPAAGQHSLQVLLWQRDDKEHEGAGSLRRSRRANRGCCGGKLRQPLHVKPGEVYHEINITLLLDRGGVTVC